MEQNIKGPRKVYDPRGIYKRLIYLPLNNIVTVIEEEVLGTNTGSLKS